MYKANLKIVEVPSFEYMRVHGQSNLRTFRDGWRVLKRIIRERNEELVPPLPLPQHLVAPWINDHSLTNE
jgi:hypothetical protein